jgi:hypothetical protein
MQELTVRYLSKCGVFAIVCGLSMSAVAPVATAQTGGQPQSAEARKKFQSDLQVLRDYIHYVRVDSFDVAAGTGKKLLDLNLKPTEFVDLVEKSGEESNFNDVMFRAMRRPEIEPVAAAMLKLFERGKLERVRDPQEIARNIQLLNGNLGQRIHGRERLIAAGEYAMPQLLEALLNRADTGTQGAAQVLLIDMGQSSVIPLATSLAQLDPVGQVQVADILGQIGYRTSLPFLIEAQGSTKSPPVREALDRAIGRIGAGGLSNDPADLYRELGEGYYAQRPELTSFPGESFQLLWAFNPGLGLSPTAIRTEVYHEAMGMRMAEKSLGTRPGGNDSALSLWLASNFRREIQSPAEYENPVYPKDRRDAMFYAVNAGALHNQGVLARALDAKDTQLARRAIAAIDQTAGGAALWSASTERRPLIEALRYPNRRVQYEAALSLGRAQPQQTFAGAERVVPILAGAIRDAGSRYAIVIAGEKELGATIRKTIEKAGYTVLPVATQLSEIAEPIAETPGIDLIVSNLSGIRTDSLIAEVRATPKLTATPILSVVGNGQDAIELGRKYDRDPLVAVRAGGIDEIQMTTAAAQLVELSSGGPIKPEEARDYSSRSLAVLRDLAISGNPVFSVGDSALQLIAALPESSGKTRLDIAEVLSRIGQKRAQVAITDSALTATGDDRVALLTKAADSAKRHGNQLEPRQVQRVQELAVKGADGEATAAAALVGSLNLPNSNLVPLILGQEPTKQAGQSRELDTASR